MKLRRAHPHASLIAILGFPAGTAAMVFVVLWIDGRDYLSEVVVANALMGACFGGAYQLGGGLTSNVRQPLWLGMLSGLLVGFGSAFSTTQILLHIERFAQLTELTIAGAWIVGALPGLMLHIFLAKRFGWPAVSSEEWKKLS